MLKGLGSAGLLSLPLVISSSATLLYVSSYAGTVTTLNLTLPSVDNTTTAALEAISSSTGCASSPSWLTLDSTKSVLYCADEGLTTPLGSLSSFQTNSDGNLVQLDQLSVISGPVSAIIYGGGEGLALAQYGGSSFSTFSVADPSVLEPLQNRTFKLQQPGPVPDRQDAPHPHEALLDPTGGYILVPDLGADLVRVFRVEEGGLNWTAIDALVAAPGSGPRHATFLVTGNRTYLYLIQELANTITGYDVTYNSDSTLGFTELFTITTHGAGGIVPSGAAAAEITLTPDNNFVIVSSRNESSLTIPNFDVSNSTEIVSDALITFSVDHSSGDLALLQTFPAGGRFPRQFSINKAGDLVAVGLQSDSRVVIIQRDTESGLLKRFIANATVAGEVTSVVFDE